MMKRIATANILFFLFTTTSIALAQLSVQITSIDTSRSPDIVLKARIMEANVRVPNVANDDAWVFENSVRQLSTITCPDQSVSIMLILDKSTSMAFFPNTRVKDPDSTRWKSAKGALYQFIDMMSPQDDAAYLSFNGAIDLDQDFTSNKTFLKDAIYGTRLGPYTAVWAAANYGVELLALRPNRRAIVLLTDGEDNFSDPITLPDVIINAQQKGVKIFAVGLGEDVGRADLDRLATSTGGKFYYSATGDDLSEIYRLIIREIGEDCTISYTSSNTCPDGTRRYVSVSIVKNNTQVADDSFYIAPNKIETLRIILPQDVVIKSGASVRIPLYLDQSLARGIPVNAQFLVQFDTTVLQWDGVQTKGTAFEDAQLTVVQTSAGLRITASQTKTTDSSSVLVYLLFTAKPTANSQTATINIQMLDFTLKCIPNVLVSNGNVLVDGTCNKLAVYRKNSLQQNTPNPFNPTTLIRFTSRIKQEVEFTVFNLLGQNILTQKWIAEEGEHSYLFDAKDLSGGVYFYRMQMGSWSETMKMVVVK